MQRAEQINHRDASLGLPQSVDRLFRYETTLKRLLDLVLAGLGLLGTLPLWLVIVIAIKLDSSGPAIFVQDRVGIHGRRFRFYKFRSMYADAEHRIEELRSSNEVSGPVFKMRSDPRVTRVGLLLRRTSLDELPQLINVLKGEMSLVGPRPPLPKEVAQYSASDMVRLSVKPGLTCLWQVSGRSNVSFEQWMDFDREYVHNLSFGLDVMILFRTVGTVLSMRGAY
ncbi:MAG: sugar transferase [Chloroflexi bacterium]|nr:MAG: sugar transferase [Chloroflexota bacterium]